MGELLELAARVEALSGPDRELDALIVTTLCPGATVSEYVRGEGDDIVFHAEALGIRDKSCCPWFTHSLDAAMTLVPEGWAVDCLKEGEPGLWYVNMRPRNWVSEWQYSKAATPALALCAAALRALTIDRMEASNG